MSTFTNILNSTLRTNTWSSLWDAHTICGVPEELTVRKFCKLDGFIFPAYFTSTKVYLTSVTLEACHKKGFLRTVAIKEDAITNVIFKASEVIDALPNFKKVLTLGTLLLRDEVLDASQTTALHRAIAVIVNAFPKLQPAYKLYLQDPDTGYKVEDFDIPNITAEDQAKILLPVKFTQGEFQFAAMMIMIYIGKPATEELYINKTLEARMRAFQYATNTLFGNRSHDKIITPNFLKLVQAAFSHLPKLFSALFSNIKLLADGGDNTATHICSMLEETNMTIFSIIDNFITTGEKTQAHVHRLIMEQIQSYLKALRELKESYGSAWKFAKLFDPTLSITNTSQWADLATVALVWATTIYPSMANIRFTQMRFQIPIHRLLATRISNEAYLNNEAVGDLEEIYKELGLDQTKVQDNVYFDQAMCDNFQEQIASMRTRGNRQK